MMKSLEMSFKNTIPLKEFFMIMLHLHVLTLLNRILLIDSKLVCQEDSFALRLIFLHLKLKHIASANKNFEKSYY